LVDEKTLLPHLPQICHCRKRSTIPKHIRGGLPGAHDVNGSYDRQGIRVN